MKKILLIVVAIVIIAVGGWLFYRSTQGNKGQAVLKVNATPQAAIFLDNQNIGKTPYEEKVAPGEHTLKLIPEGTTETLVPWEGKITLTANLLTFVNRDLGTNELASAGEILSLEQISGKQGEISVLSTPDGGAITLNGADKGTTPLVIQDVEPGSYELGVSSAGYKTRSLKVKATGGYKLVAMFQLALSGEPSATPAASPTTTPTPSATSSSPKATPKTSPKTSASPSSSPKASPAANVTPPPRPYVQILDTPTGFLRVRAEAASSAEEVGRVNPGEYYSLLDEQSGWYKIEYTENEEGWISSQYAQKFE